MSFVWAFIWERHANMYATAMFPGPVRPAFSKQEGALAIAYWAQQAGRARLPLARKLLHEDPARWESLPNCILGITWGDLAERDYGATTLLPGVGYSTLMALKRMLEGRGYTRLTSNFLGTCP